MAEVVPEFPGAYGSVEAYILNNFMLQPGFVRSDFTTFRAKVRFTVNEKGRPYNIKILQCSHEGLYLSLLGLIKKMPAWNMRSYVGPYGPLEYSIEFEIPPVSDDDY